MMQLKIWHKMIIGISIPSFIAVLGGVLTFGYINDVKNRQGYVQISDDLREHVLELRRNEKNFIHFKNEEHLKNLQSALDVLKSSITGITAEVAEEIGEGDIQILTSSINVYANLIDKLYKNYLEENEVTSEVRAEGRKLENFVISKKHAEELSTSFILNLRRLEKNYMLFRDTQSYKKLNIGLSQLKNFTPYCYECIPYTEAIHKLFKTYQKSDSMVNEMQTTGIDLEKLTRQIANLERQKISSFLTLNQRLLLVALVLLFILGPLFVYKTATYIVAPIKRLSEITRKISEGDMTLRAPLKEHDETYSLAQSFNTMLDNLEFTHHSLEKSVDLLQEKQSQLVESEKRASIGLLVSGVAHELNNPLNNISLTAETMMEDLEELNHKEMKSCVYDILAQSERAHNIVENLLDFARARRATVMEQQDIISIVKESLKLIANQLRVNNIVLHQDIPDGIFYVKGNRSKLEQIFISVAINAIQAMKENGTLTVAVQPNTSNRKVQININDTGPGIPQEHIKNIFEPFFTTKAVGKGTGLGLSVSHSLVKEHGGEIEVESKIGEGTTFTIILPLYEETV
jgi:signal transduction histidine kinase